MFRCSKEWKKKINEENKIFCSLRYSSTKKVKEIIDKTKTSKLRLDINLVLSL